MAGYICCKHCQNRFDVECQDMATCLRAPLAGGLVHGAWDDMQGSVSALDMNNAIAVFKLSCMNMRTRIAQHSA